MPPLCCRATPATLATHVHVHVRQLTTRHYSSTRHGCTHHSSPPPLLRSSLRRQGDGGEPVEADACALPLSEEPPPHTLREEDLAKQISAAVHNIEGVSPPACRDMHRLAPQPAVICTG